MDLKDLVSTLEPNKPRRNPNRPPWMTQHILREIRRRKRIWKDQKDSERYEEQSRLVKHMIRNAKRKLERRLAEGGGNNRPFYSYVRNKIKNRVGEGRAGRAFLQALCVTRARVLSFPLRVPRAFSRLFFRVPRFAFRFRVPNFASRSCFGLFN